MRLLLLLLLLLLPLCRQVITVICCSGFHWEQIHTHTHTHTQKQYGQNVAMNLHHPSPSPLLVQTFCFIWAQSASYLLRRRNRLPHCILGVMCPGAVLDLAGISLICSLYPVEYTALYTVYSAAPHPLSAQQIRAFFILLILQKIKYTQRPSGNEMWQQSASLNEEVFLHFQ